ncbi:hypothetical protein [Frigoribacterium sp. RIT-PI-h]|nr:hypothetical protein [Frigoribacterium sp. RIT-PI-h]
MSDLVTELREIASTLPTNGQIHTVLYAADLIEENRNDRLRVSTN